MNENKNKFDRVLSEAEIRDLPKSDIKEYYAWLQEKKEQLDQEVKDNDSTLQTNYRILEAYRTINDKKKIEAQKEILKRGTT